MKPTGKYLKVWESGYLARVRGSKLTENPHEVLANRLKSGPSMSSWWESGWMAADRDIATGEGNGNLIHS